MLYKIYKIYKKNNIFFEGHDNFDNQFYYRFDIWQVLSGNLAMYFRMKSHNMPKYTQNSSSTHVILASLVTHLPHAALSVEVGLTGTQEEANTAVLFS